LIAQAITHKGFSYLHVLSPCVTFDKTNMTYANLDLQVRDLPEDHDSGDLMAALAAANAPTPALGLFYREERPTLTEAMDDVVREAGGEPRGALARSA